MKQGAEQMYHLALILIGNLLPDQVHSRASKVVPLVLDLLWLDDVLHQSVLNTGDVKIKLEIEDVVVHRTRKL